VRAADEAAALADVTVGVTDLIGPGGAVIRSAPHVALFREHYVELRRGSPGGGEGSAEVPGLVPDALVPFRDPATGRAPAPGAKYKAQPFAVEAGRNQPVWVDVAVPRETMPGTYRGTWWVKSADGGRAGGGSNSRSGARSCPRRPPCAPPSTSGTTTRWLPTGSWWSTR
jgi:hypothetical protein